MKQQTEDDKRGTPPAPEPNEKEIIKFAMAWYHAKESVDQLQDQLNEAHEKMNDRQDHLIDVLQSSDNTNYLDRRHPLIINEVVAVYTDGGDIWVEEWRGNFIPELPYPDQEDESE